MSAPCQRKARAPGETAAASARSSPGYGSGPAAHAWAARRFCRGPSRRPASAAWQPADRILVEERVEDRVGRADDQHLRLAQHADRQPGLVVERQIVLVLVEVSVQDDVLAQAERRQLEIDALLARPIVFRLSRRVV